MFAFVSGWKHRLGYSWHLFVQRHTYWLVERPDKSAGFVSCGDRRAVTHFARYYLDAGDAAVVRRRWHAGKFSTYRMRSLARRYGLAVATDGLASVSLKRETLAWPSLVELVIELPATVEAARKSLPWSAKSDLSRIKRHGFTTKVSRDPRRLKEFYHHYFLPSVTKKHKDNAYVFSLEDMMKMFAEGRDSELLEVWREDIWVGGLLYDIDEDGVHFRRVGWLDGDATHYQQGVPGALHWFAIVRAIEHKKRRIIFGGCAPYLEDGLLHAKMKWGARLSREHSKFKLWRVKVDPQHRDCRAFFKKYSLLLKSDSAHGFDVLSGRIKEDVKQASKHAAQLHEWRLLHELSERGGADD